MQENGKFYIALNGVKYEVSKEVHEVFYQAERKEKNLAEKDQAHNVFLLHIAGMEELETDYSRECCACDAQSLDEMLISKEIKFALHQCINQLPRAERELIKAIYFEEETESSYAERVGLTQSGVSRKRKKILAKLKTFMEKIGSFPDFVIFLL